MSEQQLHQYTVGESSLDFPRAGKTWRFQLFKMLRAADLQEMTRLTKES